MYGLTHSAIVDALVAARNRGVDVALKLDKLESAGKTQAVVITKQPCRFLMCLLYDARPFRIP
jgi:hypothetical protein